MPATRFVDPAGCRPWPGQPRPAETLTPEGCADLIASIGTHGQAMAAIVRPLPPGDTHDWEIVCGARRHVAVAHLSAQGADIALLVEPRDLDDAAAFRLADIENRARRDISDHARALAYADALPRHYGGVQRRMAEALGVSEAWLCRHLQLSRLPASLLAAFASPDDVKEGHARRISRLLADPGALPRLEAQAARIAEARAAGARIGAGSVLRRLSLALPRGAARQTTPPVREFRRAPCDKPVRLRRRGGTVTLSFDADIHPPALAGALQRVLRAGWA